MTGDNFSGASATIIKSETQYHVLGTSGKCYNIEKIIQSGNQMFFVVDDSWYSCKESNEHSNPSSPDRNLLSLEIVKDATSESDQENPQSSESLSANILSSPSKRESTESAVSLDVSTPTKLLTQQPFDRRLLVGPVTISKVEESDPVAEIGQQHFIEGEDDNSNDLTLEADSDSSKHVQASDGEIFDTEGAELAEGPAEEFPENPEGGFAGNKLVQATTKEVMDIKPLIEASINIFNIIKI
jgi:hypothetical protein